jgi:hypothetical protein
MPTTAPPVIDWATAEDQSILSDALSHYGAESLIAGLIEPLAAGRIRPYWPSPEQLEQSATYGAMLAAEALYKQSDRLQRRTDRTAAARANELGLAFAAGRLVFWNRADDRMIRTGDDRALLEA